MLSQLILLKPSEAELPAYKAALERGWSPDNLATERRRLEELDKIAQDPEAFLNGFDDPTAAAGPVTLPDGSQVARLPCIGRWIWDGEFCGHIGLRWQNGTPDLPPTCLGHIGYSVVPWKQKRGYATMALRLMLVEAQKRLPYVEITTDPENVASQKVIMANGGYLAKHFESLASLGGGKHYCYRIEFNNRADPA